MILRNVKLSVVLASTFALTAHANMAFAQDSSSADTEQSKLIHSISHAKSHTEARALALSKTSEHAKQNYHPKKSVKSDRGDQGDKDDHNKRDDDQDHGSVTPPLPPAVPTFTPGLTISSGNVALAYPLGVAVDSGGTIFVSDTFNNQIQVFDKSGNFLRAFGANSTDPVRFLFPMALAVDRSGDLFVQDAGNSLVTAVKGDGSLIWSLSAPGSMPGTDSAGNIYFADSNQNLVVVHSADGTLLRSFGGTGNGNGQLLNPQGIAIDANDMVYVSDQRKISGLMSREALCRLCS